MKTLRLIVALALVSLLGVADMYAVKLNDSEKEVQRSLVEFLRSRKFAPSIDANDQSVCFKKDGVLYWIEFKGNSDMMLYTLYRNGVNYAKPDDPKLSHKSEVAMMATNMINTNGVVKAYQRGGTASFCMSMYAKTPTAFQEAFASQMRALSTVKDDFDKYYKYCKAKVDSIHRYWYDLDTAAVVMEQRATFTAAPARNLEISRISVRNIDVNDNIISDYDQGIRKSKASFLQPKVTLKADQSGMYKVGMKLYTPNHKLLLPSKDARFTTISTIKVAKGNKEAEYDLLKFGSKNPDDWAPGEYKIEFYEDDTLIYTDAINIL